MPTKYQTKRAEKKKRRAVFTKPVKLSAPEDKPVKILNALGKLIRILK